MKNDAPRSGRASTVVLVVLLLTAAIVTAGLFFLVKYTVDDGFDLHLDFFRFIKVFHQAHPKILCRAKGREAHGIVGDVLL